MFEQGVIPPRLLSLLGGVNANPWGPFASGTLLVAGASIHGRLALHYDVLGFRGNRTAVELTDQELESAEVFYAQTGGQAFTG